MGENVGNDEDIVTSDTFGNAELTLTGLETGELSVDYIVFAGVAGIICIYISGSLSTDLSLLGKDIRNLLYKFFVGSMCNYANGPKGASCVSL